MLIICNELNSETVRFFDIYSNYPDYLHGCIDDIFSVKTKYSVFSFPVHVVFNKACLPEIMRAFQNFDGTTANNCYSYKQSNDRLLEQHKLIYDAVFGDDEIECNDLSEDAEKQYKEIAIKMPEPEFVLKEENGKLITEVKNIDYILDVLQSINDTSDQAECLEPEVKRPKI